MTEKKRITDQAWKAKNKKRLGVTLWKSDAEAFEAYAAGRGLSVNGALRECVAEKIGRPLERRGPGTGEE